MIIYLKNYPETINKIKEIFKGNINIKVETWFNEEHEETVVLNKYRYNVTYLRIILNKIKELSIENNQSDLIKSLISKDISSYTEGDILAIELLYKYHLEHEKIRKSL